MDLRRLRYFAVLAEELHFRRAAERLFIAQPGLSQQIRVLERELGVTLFERSTAGVRLTEAGQVLRDEGVPLLSQVDRVTDRVRAAAAGRSGSLRVVHSRSLTGGVADELVRSFRARNVGVDIAAETAWTTRNLAMLRAGEADVAFVRLPLVDADDIGVLRLGETPLVVVLPAHHPLAERRALSFADVHDWDVVSWPRDQAPGYFDAIQGAVWGDRRPRLVGTEPDPERLVEAVAEGVGICVMDAHRAERLRSYTVVLRRFAKPPLRGSFGLAWSLHHVSTLGRTFIDHCRASAR